jgi:hypothetical protein
MIEAASPSTAGDSTARNSLAPQPPLQDFKRWMWHTKAVQRFCALLLLTLSAWLLVAPLAELPAEQKLPVCCRRAGSHHCALGSAAVRFADRQQASFRSIGCRLMPHDSLAAPQKPVGLLTSAGLAFPFRWSAFISTSSIEGYARALALKSPRGPPDLSRT